MGEPLAGPVPELGAGLFAVVRKDLAVGQAAVVVDRGVDVLVAAGCLSGGVPVGYGLPQARQPPPSGILATFLVSMCTSSPGVAFP